MGSNLEYPLSNYNINLEKNSYLKIQIIMIKNQILILIIFYFNVNLYIT